MGDRRFTDRDGKPWDVVARSKREWMFEPVDDNPGPARAVEPPGYESDPFELSVEELQHLLDQSEPPHRPHMKSPFLD